MAYNPSNPNGQATSANSAPVVIASDQSSIPIVEPDLFFTGQTAQTSLINNIIPATASANATDASGYRSASVQLVCPAGTYTTGQVIFEGSNDNVNFQTIPVYSQLILTGTPIVAAITLATTTSLVYTFPIQTRYIRVRIAVAITGASAQVQAFTRLSQAAWSPAILQVAQGTAANLNTTATIGSGTITTVTTVGSVTSSNAAIPLLVADVVSAAITSTTTTAAFTPSAGSSYMIFIPVTAGVGTGTFQVTVQESPDSGTTWYTVYNFPATVVTASVVGANANQESPVITLTGNRVRYVQTLTGVTSITRAISRLQSSQSGYAVPTGTVYTDRSGSTSATPSTSTQVAASNSQRRYFIIQNVGASSIWINFTSAATAGSGSLLILAQGSYVMESSTITTEAINVLSASASVAFTAKEG